MLLRPNKDSRAGYFRHNSKKEDILVSVRLEAVLDNRQGA